MKITLYTVSGCQFSQKEKEYLKTHNLAFEEKNLEHNKEWLSEMLTVGSNFAGTPVTNIQKDDGKSIVLKGFTEKEFDDALGIVKTEGATTQLSQDQQSTPITPQSPTPSQPDTSTPTPPQPPAPEQPPQPQPPTPQAPNPEPPMPTVIEPPKTGEQIPPVQPPPAQKPQQTTPAQPPANDPQLNSILNNLQSMANQPGVQTPAPPDQPQQSSPQTLPNIPNPNF